MTMLLRLYTLMSTLHHLPRLPSALPGDGSTFEVNNVDICIPSAALLASESHKTLTDDTYENGVISDSHGSSSTLVRALSVKLCPGMHLMITGSNGVGKTAIARVLAGLWAPSGPLASVTRPSSDIADDNGTGHRPRPGVFVVPQRAYMVAGSLLEQVIYPQSLGMFYAEGGDVAELQVILDAAHLGYLVEREGGWETVKEWRDVLSGGEKQRVSIGSRAYAVYILICVVQMALARVFYHRPKFAILDGRWLLLLVLRRSCYLTVRSACPNRVYECGI